MPFHLMIKLTVPIVFFGYAVFANVMLLNEDIGSVEFDQFLNGGVTEEVDELYRSNLPHQEAAVGLIGAARYLVLNEGRSGVVVGLDGWLFSSEEFRDQSQALAVLPETLQWITEVQSELNAKGAELVIVPIPAKIEIAQDYLSDASQAEQIVEVYDAFLEGSGDAGLKVVDTRSALFDVAPAFFSTDTHWTIQGAEAVAEAVSASGFIPLGDETFAEVPQAAVTFSGDLVSFVTTEDLAPAIGLGTEQIVPVTADGNLPDNDLEGGLDLFGTSTPIPVALVGTSYSANTDWSFAELLKIALSQDVLNYAKEGQGPVIPMQDYLADLTVDDVPAVVIWEFPIRYLTDPDLMPGFDVEGDDNA